MKKIVFVNPPLTLQQRYGRFALSGTKTPPHGLCNLAAVSRAAGYETLIIDAEALGMTGQEVATALALERPDYVGITATTVSIANAGNLAALVKEVTAAPVLIGGPHLTAVPEATMARFGGFDLGILGEGEDTLVELLGALDRGEPLGAVAGLILRSDGALVRTRDREPIADLDRLPLPAWDLLPDLTRYYQTPTFSFGRDPSTSLVSSRGCVGRCLFCDRRVFGNRTRAYSAGHVIRMVRHLMRHHGVRDVLFHDDSFVIFKKRLVEFCNTIIDERIDLTWSCNARVDLVDPETLRLMRRAGCWQIGYGIESGSQRILDLLRKRVTLEQIEAAVRWTRASGMRTRGFFMIGHPTETEETVQQTIAFAKRLPIDCFQITFFTPLPGSEIYEQAGRYGLLDEDWSKMSMWEPVFLPHGLTWQQLVRLQRRAFREFYFRPRVALSYLGMLRSREHLFKLVRGAVSLIGLSAARSPR